MIKKYGHRRTRLDERFKNFTIGMYEYYIPRDCIFRTFREYADYLMLCWGYCENLRRGNTTKECGWACEYSKRYDKKKFMKMIMSK